MMRWTSLGLQRALKVSLLVSTETLFFLLPMNEPKASILSISVFSTIIVLGMSFSGLGLGVGSHLVVQYHVPPPPGRLIGAALMGGFAGAVLCFFGLLVGAVLADQLGIPSTGLFEGVGFAALFLPFWIFFSGSFAIGARYLAARLRGNQLLVALGAGAAGALAGESLMTLTLFRPTPPATGLQVPLIMTATLGALVAAGLAWAERKVPHGNPEAADTSSATDTTEQ